MLYEKSLSTVDRQELQSPFDRFVALDLLGAPPREHRNAFAKFVEEGGLASQLNFVARNDDVAELYARGSYSHANGFDKVLVGRSECGSFHLRVHFWPDHDYEEQNVHDHRFAFWSYVLRGAVESHVWRPCPEGHEFRRYVYAPRGDAESYALAGQETVRLNIAGSDHQPAGSVYPFEHHKLHTIKCYGQPVTVLLEDRRNLLDVAQVYSRHLRSDEIVVSSPALAKADYLASINRALEVASPTEDCARAFSL